MIGSRLSDPRRVAANAAKLNAMQEKVSSCMTRLFRKPEHGGNPFLFAFAAPKPHELVVENGSQKIDTAATDGRKYYWNPDFLEKLTADELAVVMQHEGYHVIFFHVKRGRGKQHQVWNISVDYVVNACILVDYEKTHRKGQLFGGNIGEPLSFKDLLQFIDGKQELPKGTFCFADKTLHGRSPESIYDEIIDHWNKSPRKCPKCGNLSMGPKGQKQKGQGQGQNPGKGKGKDKGDGQGQGEGEGEGDQPGQGQGQGQGECGDEHGDGCGGCGPDHDGQFDHQDAGQSNGQKGKQSKPGSASGKNGQDDCGECPSCGSPLDRLGGMDSHIDTDMTKQEVEADIMRAADQATQMRGTVPSEIEGMLGELKKPTLKFTDIVRCALLKKVQDAGLNNDWKRIRRRYLSTDPKQYLPRRYMHKPRWLAMLDTSGSMGDDDLAYAISQLQVLGNNTEGYILACDAQPHWNSLHKVEKIQDLKRTKVIGRGGTVFDDFFRQFPEKLGTNFDVLIVLTDGDCGVVPYELRPRGMDCVWVITRNNTGFKPSFGRCAPLRTDRP